jgi:hypothetical protein
MAEEETTEEQPKKKESYSTYNLNRSWCFSYFSCDGFNYSFGSWVF